MNLKARSKSKKARYESFGGIVSSKNAPYYKVLSKDQMLKLGLIYSNLWDAPIDYLSSPTTVDFSFSENNFCGNRSFNIKNDEPIHYNLPYSSIKNLLHELHSMGVFHLSLRGDNLIKRDDFLKIINYSKNLGLSISYSINIDLITKKNIENLKLLNGLNICIESKDEFSNRKNESEIIEISDYIQKSGVSVTISYLISINNFKNIESIFQYANKAKINTIEFCRYKPTGINKLDYLNFALTQEMIKKFYLQISKYSKLYNIKIKTDCSFVPALAFHFLPKELIKEIATTGCEGGNFILAANIDGTYSPCRNFKNSCKLDNLKKEWHSSNHFIKFRQLSEKIEKPCKSCEYLEVCKGGCRIIALNKYDNFFAPDPECPFVVEYNKKQKIRDQLI